MSTQTDRELLEMAAKAAGYKSCGMYEDVRIYLLGIQAPWIPLTCDGDALRLAVKLKLKGAFDEVWVISWTSISEYEADPHAATRRAIVRAAANIGKAMP